MASEAKIICSADECDYFVAGKCALPNESLAAVCVTSGIAAVEASEVSVSKVA